MHYDNYNLHCVISIHALLAESDGQNLINGIRLIISIHALLAESDICVLLTVLNHLLFLSTLSLRRATRNGLAMRWNTCISIHALLAESDRRGAVICYLDNIISIHALLAESDSMMQSTGVILILFLSTLSLRRATLGNAEAVLRM